MFNRMNHMGIAFLELTGSFIAKRLPFYTVNFIWLNYIIAIKIIFIKYEKRTELDSQSRAAQQDGF